MTATSFHTTNDSKADEALPLAQPGAVRRATGHDAPNLARMLGRAFEADPVTAWFFPQPSERREGMERMFRLLTLPKLALPHDETYTTHALVGAALWQPPGTYEMGPVESLRLLPTLARVAGRGLPRALRGLAFMDSAHPREPHY